MEVGKDGGGSAGVGGEGSAQVRMMIPELTIHLLQMNMMRYVAPYVPMCYFFIFTQPNATESQQLL